MGTDTSLSKSLSTTSGSSVVKLEVKAGEVPKKAVEAFFYHILPDSLECNRTPDLISPQKLNTIYSI